MADSFTITSAGLQQLADDFNTNITGDLEVLSSESVLLASDTSPTFNRTVATSILTYNNDTDRIFTIPDPSGTTDDDVNFVFLKNTGGDVLAQMTGLSLDYPRGGKFILNSFTIRVG